MNIESYQENGYLRIKNFLTDFQVAELHKVLSDFHQLWKGKNPEFYQQQAVNSAYLTSEEFLNSQQRQLLFNCIGSAKLMRLVKHLIPEQACFLNTQLFFDPVNKQQANYWHRDPQYHLSVEQQKAALSALEVIHFRLPVVDERGIELVPGTHKRWDSDEELDVRLEQNNRKNNEALSTGEAIELSAGDLLIFSANMIHRGLYGMDRLAFDILFCQPDASIIEFVRDDCLPSPQMLLGVEDASAFDNTVKIKAESQSRQ
jgi:ectoine hydroxylase-related dioxygenase (phytanoyl-CoA dioxygenase family)